MYTVYRNVLFTIQLNLFETATWRSRNETLAKYSIEFRDYKDKDIIDEIWPPNERPKKANSTIEIHELKYAGC
jgi:hypothetical protein